jgi:hypothetical protein
MAPAYVTEEQPYRPEMILWLELPDDIVVSCTLVDPKGPPVAFGESLLDAMESPLVGPSRRPVQIRVANSALAAEAREVVPDIDVVVAPTPELDRVLHLMAKSLTGEGGEGPSYLEDGRIPTDTIEALFHAAQSLFRVAPWKVVDDSQVLRLDIPALEVEGACVSIIGGLGESLGIVIFPSLVAFDTFLDAVGGGNLPEGPMDLGSRTLSLNFERGADLPPKMRREISEHGWPVADPTAYPWIQHRDRDALPRPLNEDDVRIVSACAIALASFFSKHSNIFEGESFEAVSETFFDDNELEVRITFPYAADYATELSGLPSSASTTQVTLHKLGRDSPCPCGSGKKYKNCCLRKNQPAQQTLGGPAKVHEVDERMVSEMLNFGAQRFGDAWLRATEDFDDHQAAVQLFAPWAVYHFVIEGKPIVQWFLDTQGHRLSNTERGWLEAQQTAWISVWEVTAVEPGSSLTLEDLLTGEQRTVMEVSGSKMLVKRDVILSRVIDYQGLSVLGGVHPRPLPPAEAAEVIRLIRGRLRRKRTVPVEHLRHDGIGRYIIARWEEAVANFDEQRSKPPKLKNTDGEDLLLTIDRFEFEPSARNKLEERLEVLEGVERAESDESDHQTYVFTRPGNPLHRGWENTVIGKAQISNGRLRLETNSVERADALRERIEIACGDLIRHRAREHSDPIALFQKSEMRPHGVERPPENLPTDKSKLLREVKQKHYADWANQPLPALGGKTPREAVRTKTGRDQVDLLLKGFENNEARLPKSQQIDFFNLRKELGFKA